MARDSRSRLALGLIAVVAWLGVLLQLCLSLRLALGSGKSLMGGLVAFFGYFTVLTNIFVALASTAPVICGRSRVGRWFGSGMVLGCATTAIALVSTVYHVLLRELWEPEGLQWVADLTLHYGVPIALFVYWICFPPSQRLPFWAPLAWCIYPVVYIVYALARGEVIGSYPYHFIDVASLGYPRVLLNSLGLLVVYVVMGSMVYGIARFRTRTPGAVRGFLVLGGRSMTYVIWRPGIGGAEQYVTEWVKEIDTAAHSNNLRDALRYQTRAAAEAAIAHRTTAGWHVREIADSG